MFSYPFEPKLQNGEGNILPAARALSLSLSLPRSLTNLSSSPQFLTLLLDMYKRVRFDKLESPSNVVTWLYEIHSSSKVSATSSSFSICG